jgi:hypothetical protein
LRLPTTEGHGYTKHNTCVVRCDARDLGSASPSVYAMTTPVFCTTRIFVSILWIAVVFNAFKGCLISYKPSQKSPLSFQLKLDTSQLEPFNTSLPRVSSYRAGAALMLHAGRIGARNLPQGPIYLLDPHAPSSLPLHREVKQDI